MVIGHIQMGKDRKLHTQAVGTDLMDVLVVVLIIDAPATYLASWGERILLHALKNVNVNLTIDLGNPLVLNQTL